MSNFRCLAMFLVASAVTAGTAAFAQNTGASPQTTIGTERELIKELKQDIKSRRQQAASPVVTPATPPGAVVPPGQKPEPRHEQLVEACKNLQTRIQAKSVQIEALRAQAAGEKNPVKR